MNEIVQAITETPIPTIFGSAEVLEDGPTSASDRKDFAALSADEKASVIGLGFTQTSWDDSSKSE